MSPRISLLALTAAAIAFSTPARAEDACTQIIVYAVKQFCSLMPNGQSLCQPVALTGPSPACQVPAPGQFKPVPLAPPTVQFPMGMPMAAPSPYPIPYPVMPPSFPPSFPSSPGNPYLASPMTAQPVSPFGAAPMPFVAPPAAAASATSPVMPPATAQAPASPSVAQPAQAIPAPPVVATSPAPQMPAPATVTAAPVAVAPVAAAPTAPVAADASTPEAVTPNLPDAPSLPAVVAEAVALFPFDSAELTDLGRQTLDSWLASAPVGMPVVVYGHADRLGPEDYNMELSQRRADAARMYLISKGKDPRDIRGVGRGEADPVKRCKGGPTDATKACLAPNRRVLITHE